MGELLIGIGAFAYTLNPHIAPVAAVGSFQTIHSAKTTDLIDARVNITCANTVNLALPVLMT